jgi:signal recognition particle receptor subunit beta
MAVINYSKKEISAKIVYYGPSLCGKTTNIQSIYASIKPDQKGKLVSLATEADRTLFFDFLPIEIANIRGFKTRLHFYTVPGQVYYNSTRRAVLTGVDGLVFVADSQRDKMEENIESLANLEENLNYYGKSVKTLPLVIQYNKRDLPDVAPVTEMEQILNQDGYPCFEAVATTGEGVLQTLTKITKMVLRHIEMGTSGKPQPKPQARAERFSVEQNAHTGGRLATPSVPLSDPPKKPDFSPSPDIPMPKDTAVLLSGGAEFSGGRIQIVGTENAKIISANAISIPLRLKVEGDSRTYTMEMAIKIDSLIPEE